jgi:hypothetical protein
VCRKVPLIPKDLFPSINNAGTVSPTNGPAIYQGQGCLINSKISMFVIYLMQISTIKMVTYVTFVTQGNKIKKRVNILLMKQIKPVIYCN